MSTTYNVTLALRTEGSLHEKVERVGAVADKAGASVSRIGSAASSVGSSIETMGTRAAKALDSVIDKAVSVGLSIAKWGSVAAVGGLAYGVGQLNSQLEQTQISFAAIFQANNLAGNFASGLQMARGQVEKMKIDVNALPGTFTQLAQIMQTVATSGISAGMNADQLRQFSGKTMMTASIVAPTIDNNLLSKEIVNLLGGKAGTHNILGLRLGLAGEEAKKFNSLTQEERWKALEKIFDRYKDASDAIAGSWKATVNTVKDDVFFKVLQPLSKPLFDNMKESLQLLHGWFMKHKAEVERYSEIVGNKLATAWNAIVQTVIKLEPVFARIAKYVENFSAGSAKHLAESAILGYGSMKMLPMAIRGIGSLGGSVMSGAGGLGAAGMGLGLAGISAAVVGLGAAAYIGAGEIRALTNASDSFHASAVRDFTDIEDNMSKSLGNLGSLLHGIDAPASALGPAFFGLVKDVTEGIRDATNEMAEIKKSFLDRVDSIFGTDFSLVTKDNVESVKEAIERCFIAGISLLPGGEIPGAVLEYLHLRNSNKVHPELPEINRDYDVGGLRKLIGYPNETGAPPKTPEARDFGTHIQKVEIVVKGSDDPSRVARSVLREMNRLAKNPTRAPLPMAERYRGETHVL